MDATGFNNRTASPPKADGMRLLIRLWRIYFLYPFIPSKLRGILDKKIKEARIKI